jgi:DNA repair protein RecO (recombination protein O)
VNKHTDKGIILARTDFGERDRILTVLLREGGKARLVAKGVRAAKSKLAGGIELLSESNIGYIKGRGEMYTLTSSRLISHFGDIVQDYDKTQLAYEILRTINKIVDDGHGQDYYPLLLASLGYLDKDSHNCDSVAIWFDLKLLDLMGHGINLRTDKENKPLAEAGKYSFDYDRNCFYPDVSGVFGKQSVKLLRVVGRSDKPVVADIPPPEQARLAQLLSQIVEETVV